MRAYERLLKYVQFDTASDETSETCPSTAKQLVLAEALVEEMKAIGIADARVDKDGYVYGSIPANCDNCPTIGLIAHMDTVSGVPCMPMNPTIVKNYDGGKVLLANGDYLDPAFFPEVGEAAGKDLIVTDGRTILGADDKAGIAEIMTACERIIADSSIPHGKIAIGFTPDEEIGRGADRFDVKGFGADFAYTLDGDVVGGIEYETFNAAAGVVTGHGLSVHPGSGKNKMRNAALVAMEFASMLPPSETPSHTEGYEGFYHLCEMSGNEETATLQYIIRDHDRKAFENRKDRFEKIGAYLNSVYGEGVVEVAVRDQYYNMSEVLEKYPEVIERARRAYTAAGISYFSKPVRGGTDGSRLSFMGLPCPNIATGGMNFHGRFECIAVQDMDTMTDVIVKLVTAGV